MTFANAANRHRNMLGMMRWLSCIVAVSIMLVMMMPVFACAATPKITRMEQDGCK